MTTTQTRTAPSRRVPPAARQPGPVTRAIRGLRPNEAPIWEQRQREIEAEERAALRALRQRIEAQMEEDQNRIDRCLSILDVLDGDPDLEADYTTIERGPEGGVITLGRSTDDEPDDSGCADLDGALEQQRHRQRQDRSQPLAEALSAWAETILPQLSGPSDLAKALRYMLSRWRALTRVFDDGRIGLDNNPAERALRGIAVGRKNCLFAGSDRGAERAATFYTLIETAKLNGLDTEAYLRDVLTRIAEHPARRLDDLLPWNWVPLTALDQAA